MDENFKVNFGLPKPKDEFADVKFSLPKPIKKDVAEVNSGLQTLIDRIPPNVPDNFKEEARRAATWITELDKGNTTLSENPEVKQWIADLSIRIGYVPNQNQLPWWLKGEIIKEAQKSLNIDLETDEDRKIRIDAKFKDCGRRNGWRTEEIDGVSYFLFNNGKGHASEADGFKISLNAKFLEQAIDSERFEKLINDLSQTSERPREMKYLEDGVIMYFRQKGQNPEETRQIFIDEGIMVGLPAQDIYRIVEKDGHLEMSNFIFSNDSASQRWNIPNKEYNQADFFRSLLIFGLETGKRLDRPNLTSFIYALTENEILKPQASVLTDLPICFSKEVSSV